MRLLGVHHATMITADAPRTVEFYGDVLGLRFVKKTVNFDQPDAYHLYFGDETGSPGSILTWFEFQGVVRGRAGAGMIHLVELGVSSAAALEFWEERLGAHGYHTQRRDDALHFTDDDGLPVALVIDETDTALRARHPAIPAEYALTGIAGARAYDPGHLDAEDMSFLTEILGFGYIEDVGFRLEGEQRLFYWAYDQAPADPGIQGAGTVHHIAWACRDEDQRAWQQLVKSAGAHVTEIIDRDYFTSIYFREPRHVLFEIATLSPGFAVDEDPAHLGEDLRLPAQFEHLRAHLQSTLTPLHNPRASRDSAPDS